MSKNFNVGVIGYSNQKFDNKKAKELIVGSFDAVEKIAQSFDISIVSGLTDVGIPSLAYKEAVKRGWKTIGVACEKAKEYDIFAVDETIIVGKEWGDESEIFLSMIDFLIKIGGGKQSKKEIEEARKNGIL